MGFFSKLVRVWAYAAMAITGMVIILLFAYVLYQGAGVISWAFITDAPRGAVLGSEGGIWPAIAGSLWFTGTAVIFSGIPALATALYLAFYCKSKKVYTLIRMVIQNIAGIPSIVLGLFSYSLLVRALGLGRCILSGGVALAIMVFPFIVIRFEKAMREIPKELIFSSYALGVSRAYTSTKIVLRAVRGELVSGLILGACFAMGATAPLIFTGGVAFATAPTSILTPAMALPLHLYLLLAQGTSMPQVYGTAFVLMVIVLVSNVLATLYARRDGSTWK